ncbi:MAG: histidinol-phosphate transaminase [Gammaproteobacteria bacterium]|nr:histidinol-phosphate transaminase [Gammaproteobacteria bacterium]
MSQTPQAATNPGAASAPQPLPQYQAISPYKQGQSAIKGQSKVIKLSSNEGCFGPSPAAVTAFMTVANDLHRYPDGSQTRLREAIADVYGLDASRIVCGNGSEELIGLLTRCFVGPGDELLLSENHFVMCSIYGKAQGAKIVLAPEEEFRTNIDAVLARITPKTKMIAIANPNNPTGTYNSQDEIDRLIASVPRDIVVILDGAYAEYVEKEDYNAGTRWVENSTNVIMTRTFSKMYGLAGLRIGWAYGPAPIVEIVNRLRTPFNTSIAALAAAEAAVQDFDHVNRVVAHNSRWQVRFQDELGALGVHVVPSVANFYLLHFENIDGKSANDAGEYLRANGIIPRPASDDRCLRLTVGNDDENEAVIRVLRNYVNG